MRRVVEALRVTLAVALGVSVVGIAPTFCMTRLNAAEKAAGWSRDFDAAQADAKSRKLPLLVHFYADWCGPCRSMESTVLNTSEVTEVLGKSVVAVKVNADHRSDLMSKFGVAALPTDVFLSPEGDVISRSVGGATRDSYLAKIGEISAKFAGAAGDANPTIAKLSQLATVSGVGLDGYSPVSLTASKLWKEGSSKYSWKHAGVVYYMADEAEFDLFCKNPEKYAPQYSGFDPLILSTDGVAVQGNVQYGSFVDGVLFLHATEGSRRDFIQEPTKYPLPAKVQTPQTVAGNGKARPVAVSDPELGS